MAPPPTLPRQRLRYTRILDVAAGFARKGLDSVVLSEVADKADVPLGHVRLMQPAVEQCLNRAVYTKDTDTTKLLREIDTAAERAVTAVSGDAAISRVLLLTVTGLVQSVRCRRLSLFEAEEDLKKACFLLTCTRRTA